MNLNDQTPVLMIGEDATLVRAAEGLAPLGVAVVRVSGLAGALLEISSRGFKVIVCDAGEADAVVGATTTPVLAVGPASERSTTLNEGATAYAERDDPAKLLAQVYALSKMVDRFSATYAIESGMRASLSHVRLEAMLTVFAMEKRTARLTVALPELSLTEMELQDGIVVGAAWNGRPVSPHPVLKLWLRRREGVFVMHSIAPRPTSGGIALQALLYQSTQEFDESRAA